MYVRAWRAFEIESDYSITDFHFDFVQSEGAIITKIPLVSLWRLHMQHEFTSRKHAYIILTPLNPTFI